MNIVLTDEFRQSLLPFTYTRPVGAIRIGILTIAEKWEKWLDCRISFQTEEYLSKKFPLFLGKDNLFINGGVLPNAALVQKLRALKIGQALVQNNIEIARRANGADNDGAFEQITFEEQVITIQNPWDIFSKNGEALQQDFDLITQGRESAPIPKGNTVIAAEHVFLEKGAAVYASVLNASTGPIYIGKDVLIMEGCLIRGGMALMEGAVLKMGSKIYGPSTFGPFCKVGGEVNNSVLFANTNKGHEGFLGNSVLGEWCNIGADANTSNLKNNYAPVKLWNYQKEGFAQTGLQFCGLMMGDHAKAGINTMFNTGTVVGVAANVFGSGFPRNFVPSFSWGGASGFSTYRLHKAFEAATAMMGRRNIPFDEVDREIIKTVFEATEKWRGK